MKFKIVIAGGGFAGVYCAKSIVRRLGHGSIDQVALIAEQNVMVFQPMLAEVAGAALSPLDVVNPLRQFCQGVNVLRGKIIRVDLERRELELDAGRFTKNLMVEFEHLVLAIGSVVDLSRVPGMPEHAHVLKNFGDALKLRAAMINRLEQANLEPDNDVIRRLLTFVVVGGGYSGVETAGQMLDLVEDVKRFYHNLRNASVRVILVHSGPRLMPEVSESLAVYAEKKLRERGMEIILNSRVVSMTANKAFLQDGNSIETNLVLSTVGNSPNPVITDICKQYGLESVKGRIRTEPSMQVKGRDWLWAAGDCAAVPSNGEPSSPPTAQFAQRQGKLLGENVAAVLSGRKPQPFHHKNLGQLASIGHRTAVAEILGMHFSGFIAWFIWRTTYLFKLPGIERKFRVMVDWTVDLFWPRDISLAAPTPTKLLQEMHLEKGDVVFHAGEPAFSFYILKEGQIDVFDGDRLLGSIPEGQTFGQHALEAGRSWYFSAIAAKTSTLVAVSREAFETFYKSSQNFRDWVKRSEDEGPIAREVRRKAASQELKEPVTKT
ncbi:FAD-dependent oxidoreductase [Pedosphaera parvula]|uniref:NADH:ubiquinone reductase (non-electrogenic) n=1 Tax=Pedosphaera parvula (strain Ellin514) TaxID=320771 RepID=B9XE71_PEDPL|nr:FAD-dependent oxidoreductase [Pedosphaera parvula]EEF61962.1 cyclic nucleotide-regulated FAD-dependent pyridine nucleotide-disulphide oxidoreductase [Pedosphaera parvula Ellin514]